MTHHIGIDASDPHSAPRLVLVCTATPGSDCRKRPTDDRETWQFDDPDLADGDCWAVDWIEAAGWDDSVRNDGDPALWPRIPVTVHYDEGVIVTPANPHPVPDHTLAIAEAARELVAANAERDEATRGELYRGAGFENWKRRVAANNALVLAVRAERADAAPLTASEPPVSTTEPGVGRPYVSHGFTPSSGPFDHNTRHDYTEADYQEGK